MGKWNSDMSQASKASSIDTVQQMDTAKCSRTSQRRKMRDDLEGTFMVLLIISKSKAMMEEHHGGGGWA